MITIICDTCKKEINSDYLEVIEKIRPNYHSMAVTSYPPRYPKQICRNCIAKLEDS